MTTGNAYISVLTGRTVAAIASIAIEGQDAQHILGKVFRKKQSGADLRREPALAQAEYHIGAGQAVLGCITSGAEVIDEVVVGTEGPNLFVIHCHGNPLLVERITGVLQSYGAVLKGVNAFFFERYSRESATLIEAEARLAMQTSATLAGVRILQAQIDGGLVQWASRTLEKIDSIDTEQIRQECRRLLERSEIGRRIIGGVRIVIAGPPNSGKSTLLNRLAGRQEAIVTDTAGTTRDWVSIACSLENDSVGMPRPTDLYAEFIDTAGLDQMLAGRDEIEKRAQEITRTLLESCDLVLYVQDVTASSPGAANPAEKPVVYVYNKCDLLSDLKYSDSNNKAVWISAKEDTDFEPLVRMIRQTLGVGGFKESEPIVFTERQRTIISKIIASEGRPANLLSDLIGLEKSD